MLQRFHGSFGLTEDRRHLDVGEAVEKLQRQHLALLGRELLDQLEHPGSPDRVERLILRRGLLRPGRLRRLFLRLHAAVRTEVIHCEVVRDPEEPGRERHLSPAEAVDRLEHAQEGLGRQILGVVAVADAEVQVAVDAIEVEEVELLQRITVAELRALDESPHRMRLRPPTDSAGAIRRGSRRVPRERSA